MHLDDSEIKDIRACYRKLRSATATAKQMNSATTTVRRVCQDLIAEEAVRQEQERDKLREHIKTLRQEVRRNRKFDVKAFAKKIGITLSLAENALIGRSFRELNAIEPPVNRTFDTAATKEQVRKLYKQGHSYKTIVKMVGVALSTVSLYCHDLVGTIDREDVRKKKSLEQIKLVATARYIKGDPMAQIAKDLGVTRQAVLNWNRQYADKRQEALQQKKDSVRRTKDDRLMTPPKGAFTDDQVCFMRNDIRENRALNYAKYRQLFGVSNPTIADAIYGRTYRHLNDKVPPIQPGEVSQHIPHKRPNSGRQLVYKLTTLMVIMRRSDPVQWNYRTLALWMREQTGKTYKTIHIMTLLHKRDPDISKLDAQFPTIPPKVPPKPRVKKEPSPRKKRAKKPSAVDLLTKKICAARQASAVIATIQAKTNLSMEEILSDDDDIDDAELAALIAAEDALEANI